MNALREISDARSLPSAPFGTPSSHFSMRSAIADYISERDKIWALLKRQVALAEKHDDRDFINPADLGRLEVANDATLKLVSLTPGPTTPVMDPLMARVEVMLCQCCTIFISHVRGAYPNTR
jgi:hypothetical protein